MTSIANRQDVAERLQFGQLGDSTGIQRNNNVNEIAGEHVGDTFDPADGSDANANNQMSQQQYILLTPEQYEELRAKAASAEQSNTWRSRAGRCVIFGARAVISGAVVGLVSGIVGPVVGSWVSAKMAVGAGAKVATAGAAANAATAGATTGAGMKGALTAVKATAASATQAGGKLPAFVFAGGDIAPLITAHHAIVSHAASTATATTIQGALAAAATTTASATKASTAAATSATATSAPLRLQQGNAFIMQPDAVLDGAQQLPDLGLRPEQFNLVANGSDVASALSNATADAVKVPTQLTIPQRTLALSPNDVVNQMPAVPVQLQDFTPDLNRVPLNLNQGVAIDWGHGGPLDPGRLSMPDIPWPTLPENPHQFRDDLLEDAQDGAFIVAGEVAGQALGGVAGAAVGGPPGAYAGQVIGGVAGAGGGYLLGKAFHGLFK